MYPFQKSPVVRLQIPAPGGEAPLPSPHLPPRPDEEPPFVWTRDRRESAIQGWKRRYARMREAGVKFKKDS